MAMKRYNARGRYRLMAEWEEECLVLTAWPAPHTDWNYMLAEARQQCLRLVTAMLDAGQRVILLHPHGEQVPVHHTLLSTVSVEYNDTWTRDYGPLTVADNEGNMRLLDFGFNAWGLKFPSDKDNLVNLRLFEKGIFPASVTRNSRDFVLEGGSVETDGHGTLLTTSRCLCSPNRNGGRTRLEMNELLHSYLGIDHVLWLDFGVLDGDDTDSHIDTLARLAPHDTIIYTGTSGTSGRQAQELELMASQLHSFRTAAGGRFNLVELPLPDPINDAEGYPLPATYANYLVTPSHIFIPAYGQPLKDRLAAQTLQSVFPTHIPVEVDCRDYICQHGSLHCATMQIPARAIDTGIL